MTFLEAVPEVGETLMLDACVYIDQLQGQLPTDAADRIMTRNAFHSSLALSEISFPFGRLDPDDTRTQGALDAIEDLISDIPDRRILTPSAETKSKGAILAGVMARILGYTADQRRKGLMDAFLAAHAVQQNLLLVTRNIADFDRLNQLDSKLKVAFYRT